MNIEIKYGVTWKYNDGTPEAFITIVNLITSSKTPEDLKSILELLDKVYHFGRYFKWSFSKHHFWLYRRKEQGSEELYKNRILISRF